MHVHACVRDLFYYKFLQFTISFWVYTINMQVNNSKKAIHDPKPAKIFYLSLYHNAARICFYVQLCSNRDSPGRTRDYPEQKHNITEVEGHTMQVE